MRYGLYVPNFGVSSFARTLADLARDAEGSGWDGFFLWDHIIEWDERVPIVDSSTALAAIAMNTKRIRIGTTVTPLPRLRPWEAARRTVSLDHLCNGRLTLGVGLGGAESTDYERFGESADNNVLAEKLDESLDIITGLWTGKPFSYRGKHYRVKKTAFLPMPKQRPRIPIWCGGFWPNKGPFKRAARWDGIIPLKVEKGGLHRPTPDDVRDIIAYVKKRRRATTPFDVAIIGWGTGKNPTRDRKRITPYIEAGMTWWLESLYGWRDSPKHMKTRILKGPPEA